ESDSLKAMIFLKSSLRGTHKATQPMSHRSSFPASSWLRFPRHTHTHTHTHTTHSHPHTHTHKNTEKCVCVCVYVCCTHLSFLIGGWLSQILSVFGAHENHRHTHTHTHTHTHKNTQRSVFVFALTSLFSLVAG